MRSRQPKFACRTATTNGAKREAVDGADERTRYSVLRVGLLRATASLLAVLASFLTVYALCRQCDAQGAPAILAGILATTLSRREGRVSFGGVLRAPVALAGTALAATGAAWLLHALPAVGAVVFVAVIFFSIWLRNFDERAKGIGAFIAMPLVALLVVPGRAYAPGGPLVDLALVISAGVVSLAYVAAAQSIMRRLLPNAAPAAHAATDASAPRKRSGIPVPTRMALQMAVALSAAFAFGFALFPAHWGWTVLTAFIVGSGARGRGDAAYKGLLRLGGAIAGTLAAAAFTRFALPSGPAEAVFVFVVLFFGLWLRDVNYAYWAACMTLILALLSRSGGVANVALLEARLEAILIGALCAVAAAWFVLPIRTEAVIRRRLADALGALDRLVTREPSSGGERSTELAFFEHRMAELEKVAIPVRWHRRVFAATGTEHPAHWIELANEVKHHARSFTPQGSPPGKQTGAIRRAIGLSRRAIADHGKPEAAPDTLPVSVALQNLRDAISQAKIAQE